MILTVLGAGPAYTDREGASGAAYLVSRRDPRASCSTSGTARSSASSARRNPRTSRRSWSATSTPTTSSISSPSVITCATTWCRHDACASSGPARSPPASTRCTTIARSPPGRWTRRPSGRERTGSATSRSARPAWPTRTTSYAVRVVPAAASAAGGRSPGLVYSGDCGRADDLRPLIAAGDTLLAEVSFGPGPVPADVLHLDGPAVGSPGGVDRRRPGAAHPHPDGLRPGRDRGLGQRRVRRTGVVRVAGDAARALTARTGRARDRGRRGKSQGHRARPSSRRPGRVGGRRSRPRAGVGWRRGQPGLRDGIEDAALGRRRHERAVDDDLALAVARVAGRESRTRRWARPRAATAPVPRGRGPGRLGLAASAAAGAPGRSRCRRRRRTGGGCERWTRGSPVVLDVAGPGGQRTGASRPRSSGWLRGWIPRCGSWRLVP